MSSKRKKIVVLSLLLSTFPILNTKVVLFNYPFLLFFIFSLLNIWAVLYIVEFQVQGWNWFLLPLYPLLLTFHLSVWRVDRTILQMLTAGAAFVFYYILFLSLNILNLSSFRPLPLKKAANSVLMLYGLFLAFLSFSLAIDPQFFLLSYTQKLVYSFVVAGILCLPIFWFIQEEYYRFPFKESLVGALFTVETLGLIGFSKGDRFVQTLFVSGSLFVLAGLISKRLEKELTRKILRDNILILAFLVFFYLYNSVR